MVVYTETNTAVYTEEELRQSIREETDFDSYLEDYISRLQPWEIIGLLPPAVLEQLSETVIDEILKEDYTKHEIDA